MKKKIFGVFIIFLIMLSCNSNDKIGINEVKMENNSNCFYVEIKDSTIINTIELFSNEVKIDENNVIILMVFENFHQYEIIIMKDLVGNINLFSNNYYTIINENKIIIRLAGNELFDYNLNMVNELKKKFPIFNNKESFYEPYAWKLIICKDDLKGYTLIRDARFEKHIYDLFKDTSKCYINVPKGAFGE